MAGVGKRHPRQARGLPLAVVSTVAVAAAPLLTSAVQAQPPAGPADPEAGAGDSGQVLSLGAPAARALGFPDGLVGAELRLGGQLTRSGGEGHLAPGAVVHPWAQEGTGSFSPGVYRMNTPGGTYHPFHPSGFTIHITPGLSGGGFPYGAACSGGAGIYHDTVTSQQEMTTSTGSTVSIHTVTYITVTSPPHHPTRGCPQPGWWPGPSAGAPPYQSPPSYQSPPGYQSPPSYQGAPPPATPDPNGSPPYRPGWPNGSPGPSPTTPPTMPPVVPSPPPTPTPTGEPTVPPPGTPPPSPTIPPTSAFPGT